MVSQYLLDPKSLKNVESLGPKNMGYYLHLLPPKNEGKDIPAVPIFGIQHVVFVTTKRPKRLTVSLAHQGQRGTPCRDAKLLDTRSTTSGGGSVAPGG